MARDRTIAWEDVRADLHARVQPVYRLALPDRFLAYTHGRLPQMLSPTAREVFDGATNFDAGNFFGSATGGPYDRAESRLEDLPEIVADQVAGGGDVLEAIAGGRSVRGSYRTELHAGDAGLSGLLGRSRVLAAVGEILLVAGNLDETDAILLARGRVEKVAIEADRVVLSHEDLA